MMKQLQEKLNTQFFSIADSVAYGLPEWDLMYRIADYARREPTPINVQYATDVYHAIKDLTSVIESFYFQVVSVDFKAKKYIMQTHTMPVISVGHVISEPFVMEYRGNEMKKTFADLEEYNRSAKVHEVLKYQKLVKSRNVLTDSDVDGVAAVHNWANNEDVIEKFKDVFLPVINKNAPGCSFEKFLEFYGYVAKDQSPDPIKGDKKFTMYEIALMLAYNKKDVSKDNAKGYLEGTGWKSGDDLYNKFKDCITPGQRKAPPKHHTRTTLNNKIKHHEKVIQYLEGDVKQKAELELEVLKSHVLD